MVRKEVVKIEINGNYTNIIDDEYTIWKEDNFGTGTWYKIDKRAPYVKTIQIEWEDNLTHKTYNTIPKKLFYVHILGGKEYIWRKIGYLTNYGIYFDNISYQIIEETYN